MLAEQLDMPLGTIAYHVRTLHSLGLLKLVAKRQRRGATEHYYETTDHPRFSDDAWDRLDVVTKHRILSSILNESHDLAMQAAATGGFDRADAHFTRTPLKLDEKGWAKLAKATKQWLAVAGQVEEESARRLERNPDATVSSSLIIQFFESAPSQAPQEAPSRGAPARRASASRSKASTRGR